MKYLLIAAFSATLFAQTGTRSVKLDWADTQNPAGTTYSVYQATGLCSGAPVFAKVATAVTTKTYTVTSVAPGNYCFQVTATANGFESAPSNTAAAAVPSFPPSALQVTVQ